MVDAQAKRMALRSPTSLPALLPHGSCTLTSSRVEPRLIARGQPLLSICLSCQKIWVSKGVQSGAGGQEPTVMEGVFVSANMDRASFFKTLIDHEVTVELKNDIQIRGTLKSVDQYLNIKLDDIQVVEEIKYPHLVSYPCLYSFPSIAAFIYVSMFSRN